MGKKAVLLVVGVVLVGALFAIFWRTPEREPIRVLTAPNSPIGSGISVSGAASGTSAASSAPVGNQPLPFALKPGWTEFEQARSSQDPKVIMKGLKALRDCASYMTSSELATTVALTEAKAVGDPRREERVAAAKALVTRCQGFTSQQLGPDEEIQLWAKAASLGDAEAQAHQYQMSLIGRSAAALADGSLKAQMCKVVQDGKAHPEVLEASSLLIAAAAQSSFLGAASGSLTKKNITDSIHYAACKLGSTSPLCTRNSVNLAAMCAIAGECDLKSEYDLHLRSMTDADKALVETLSNKIVAGVEAGSCEGFF